MILQHELISGSFPAESTGIKFYWFTDSMRFDSGREVVLLLGEGVGWRGLPEVLIST